MIDPLDRSVFILNVDFYLVNLLYYKNKLYEE